MDIDPEKREGLLEAAALGGQETIGGLTLQPMTGLSYTIHNKVKGIAGAQSEDLIFSLFSFAYVHAQPVEKLRSLFATPHVLLDEIVGFMSEHEPGDAFIWKPWSERQMEQLHASITRVFDSGQSGSQSPKV